MKPFREAMRRVLRSRPACTIVEKFGIDAKRYWLLVDLFGELSERGEMRDQLGLNKVELRVTCWIYFALSLFLALIFVLARPTWGIYLSGFLVFTALMLTVLLFTEVANSLANPAEALVLAHQPINGATYTGAKLTHLVRILLLLVPGLNAGPAVAGLWLPTARWFYPLAHIAAALAVGFVTALFCCALFGWLIRFLPARRVKETAQFAAAAPFLLLMMLRLLPRGVWRSLGPAPRISWPVLGTVLLVAAVVFVTLGVRSLSLDYLIRVSGMMRGGSTAGARRRESPIGEVVCRFFGGQPGRAASAFISRMMRRDWHFRRQFLPLVYPPFMGIAMLIKTGWKTDPFSGSFTAVHLLPHMIGLLLFFVCSFLPFGSDHQAAWIFAAAPARVMSRFARGAFGLLWLGFVVLPALVVLAIYAWLWGLWHAALFAGFSIAAGSVYLALEIRLIQGAPFTRQAEARSADMLPLMMLGGLAMAAAVGLQYLLLFRSVMAVGAVTVMLGVAAYFTARAGIDAFAASILYHLGLSSGESGKIYKEVSI